MKNYIEVDKEFVKSSVKKGIKYCTEQHKKNKEDMELYKEYLLSGIKEKYSKSFFFKFFKLKEPSQQFLMNKFYDFEWNSADFYLSNNYKLYKKYKYMTLDCENHIDFLKKFDFDIIKNFKILLNFDDYNYLKNFYEME